MTEIHGFRSDSGIKVTPEMQTRTDLRLLRQYMKISQQKEAVRKCFTMAHSLF